MQLTDMVRLADTICDYSWVDDRPEWLRKTDSGYHPRSGSNECAFYYKFLFALAQQMQPSLIVELGTGTAAISAFHFATGCPTARVITVDTSDVMLTAIAESPAPHIEGWVGHSLALYSRFVSELQDPIDIFFLDTSHVYEETVQEYQHYQKLMKRGGIMLFDDIASASPPHFWEIVEEPKAFHPVLHDHCGFGIAIVGES